jgi:hypothetical protein
MFGHLLFILVNHINPAGAPAISTYEKTLVVVMYFDRIVW